MVIICWSYIIHPDQNQFLERRASNSVCYYAVHESVAMGESLGHIPSKENIADLLTKVLYGQKRRYLVSNILYDIHDDH